MIKVVIIDDEPFCIESLQYKLSANFPDIQITGTCQNAREGIQVLQEQRPDLVFLDINLPDLDGFRLLEQLTDIPFQVIFTTAYNEFAVKAFKFNALDYLLKPIDEDDLIAAVERYRDRARSQSTDLGQLQLLVQVLRQNNKELNRIALPTARGQLFVSLNDITRLEAESNYTRFYLCDKTSVLVAKTLKDYEQSLRDHNFIRVHNSFIINLLHVKEYHRGGTVLMDDGMEIEISVRKKQLVLEKLSNLLKG